MNKDIQKENKSCVLFYWIVFGVNNEIWVIIPEVRKIESKKKNTAHAYFEHRIFSKFFGGKN